MRGEINRSGSGGSGGSADAGILEEGSGSESLTDMLAGKVGEDDSRKEDR